MSIKSENFIWCCKHEYFRTGSDCSMYEWSWPVQGRRRYCQTRHNFCIVWRHSWNNEGKLRLSSTKKGNVLHISTIHAQQGNWIHLAKDAVKRGVFYKCPVGEGSLSIWDLLFYLSQQPPGGQNLLFHKVFRYDIYIYILCIIYCLYLTPDYFILRCRTAGYKSVTGGSCDRPSRHRFFLVFLGPRANAGMIPIFLSKLPLHASHVALPN
jgi:hypothetical protein